MRVKELIKALESVNENTLVMICLDSGDLTANFNIVKKLALKKTEEESNRFGEYEEIHDYDLNGLRLRVERLNGIFNVVAFQRSRGGD